MSMKHIVQEQGGISIHREVPAKRGSDEFDLTKMSTQTREAFKRVCRDGGAEPEDYRHVFESLLGRALVEDILK